MENVDTYVQDVIHHVELMRDKYPRIPCIIMGHSMVRIYPHSFMVAQCPYTPSTQGGLIAAHASMQRQDMFAGLVLSAAAVKPVVMSAVAAAIVVSG